LRAELQEEPKAIFELQKILYPQAGTFFPRLKSGVLPNVAFRQPASGAVFQAGDNPLASVSGGA
jgi:hypothetical protein